MRWPVRRHLVQQELSRNLQGCVVSMAKSKHLYKEASVYHTEIKSGTFEKRFPFVIRDRDMPKELCLCSSLDKSDHGLRGWTQF